MSTIDESNELGFENVYEVVPSQIYAHSGQHLHDKQQMGRHYTDYRWMMDLKGDRYFLKRW